MVADVIISEGQNLLSAGCSQVLDIRQYGSTRSINASAAGAIAMYAWALQHANHQAE